MPGAVTVTVTNLGAAERKFGEWVHLRCCAPTVSSVSSEQRIDGGRYGSDDHGDELCGGSDGDVWRHGGNQRGGGEQHVDHGDDAGACGGCGDGDGDGERPARESGERVYLRCATHGDQCLSEQRVDGGRNGGDDHRDQLCRWSDGDVRRDGGNQCGGGEQYVDHGDDAGARGGGGDGDGDESNGQPGSLTNGFTYVVVPTVSSVSPNSGSTAGGTAVTITGTELCRRSDGDVWRDGGNQCGGCEQYVDHGDDAGARGGGGNGDGDDRIARPGV